jgi:hypothetical protein
MQKTIVGVIAAAAVAAVPVAMLAQSKPTAATYITKEEVDKVNATPGVDRTLKVVDIGSEHFSVGIIHRGATAAAGAGRAGGAAGGGAGRAAGGGAAAGGGRGAGGGAAAGGGRGAAAGGGAARGPATPDCGEINPNANTQGGAPGMIAHDFQTEGYYIVSGGGTMITGGHIVNGRKSAPDAEVTTTLNGPSCSGTAVGSDIVRREVKTGDIIIIPAGVPHGWTGITDHVDYLSFRPSQQTLTVGYVNPAIK